MSNPHFIDPRDAPCSYHELRRRQSVDAAAKAADEAERAGRRVHPAYQPEVDWEVDTEVGPLPAPALTPADVFVHGGKGVNGPNPKDLAGRCKPDLSLVTGSMMAAIAAGLADGKKKYGLTNWRKIAVEALTYTSAAQRHIKDWEDGEELAPDSLVHHLGHAAASLCVLIDAIACSTWIDNRATPGRSAEIFAKMASHNLMRELQKHPPEPKAGPQLPAELAHPAARLATAAFAAEQAQPEKLKRTCGMPASCHSYQRCLGGPRCERYKP